MVGQVLAYANRCSCIGHWFRAFFSYSKISYSNRVASFVLAGGSIGTSNSYLVRLSGFEDVDESELGDESGLLQQTVEVVLVVSGGVIRGDFVDVVMELNSAFIY